MWPLEPRLRNGHFCFLLRACFNARLQIGKHVCHVVHITSKKKMALEKFQRSSGLDSTEMPSFGVTGQEASSLYYAKRPACHRPHVIVAGFNPQCFSLHTLVMESGWTECRTLVCRTRFKHPRPPMSPTQSMVHLLHAQAFSSPLCCCCWLLLLLSWAVFRSLPQRYVSLVGCKGEVSLMPLSEEGCEHYFKKVGRCWAFIHHGHDRA